MKNHNYSLRILLGILLVFSLSLPFPCFASEAEVVEDVYIFDEAGLFSVEQYNNLQEYSVMVAEYSGCGIYFMSVDDFTQVSSCEDIWPAAEEIYLDKGLGVGEEQTGIFLLLSMEERDYALVAYGTLAHTAFTDYGKDVMSEYFLDDFAANQWYSGAVDYLVYSGELLNMALEGTPLDVQGHGQPQEQGSERDPLMAVAMALLPAGALSIVICLLFKRQMKTARTQLTAFEYIVDGSVDFRVRQDRFMHVTRTRRRINTNNGPKLGGGTTVGSGGFSGKSGKF